MAYWAKAPMDRQQLLLFHPTLDDCIPEDHPVRLFWEVLSQHDWSAWEARYHGFRGQPPIHPRVMAGIILYGLSKRVRSSRMLEDACGNRLDFMWMAEGRQPDHSTLCNFRTSFESELKDLFRQIGRIAMTMGLIRLNQVALDGTRVRANSSRHRTARQAKLKDRLKALDQHIEELFSEAAETDRQENLLFGESESPNRLPRELARLKDRRDRLQKALDTVQELDKKRAQRKDMGSKGAQVPVADPESRVLPNKEGGSAPNYTPVAGADGHGGFIVGTALVNDNSEDKVLPEMVDSLTDDLGEQPEQILGDSAYSTGVNLKHLDDREIEILAPVTSMRDDERNPANREDPSQPVPAQQWDQLPMNPQSKRLDKAAFVYDPASDTYRCPMGKLLSFSYKTPYQRKSGLSGIYRVYQCADCAGCPLRNRCFSEEPKSRSVMRDEYEPYREAVTKKLRDPEKRKAYDRRMWIAETPMGVIKDRMGLRQFLLRGLKKVKMEWDWACCAYNLDKLVREIMRLRISFATAAI